jgi:hypothetical protein
MKNQSVIAVVLIIVILAAVAVIIKMNMKPKPASTGVSPTPQEPTGQAAGKAGAAKQPRSLSPTGTPEKKEGMGVRTK